MPMRRHALVAAVLAAAGCGFAVAQDPAPAKPEPSAKVERLNQTELAKASPGVFIYTKDKQGGEAGVGAGVFLSPELVLTAASVVERAAGAEVMLLCCERYPVRGIVALDVTRGLALLRVEGAEKDAVAVQVAAGPPEKGQELAVHAMVPALKADAQARAQVFGVREWPQVGERLTVQWYSELAVPGSPVVDGEGRLVGLVTGSLTDRQALVSMYTGAEGAAGPLTPGDLLPLAEDAGDGERQRRRQVAEIVGL
jgi:hypothetical protein